MKVNQRAVFLLLNLVATFNVNEGFTLLVQKSSSLPGDLLKLNMADYLSNLNQPFSIPDFSAVAAPAAAAPSYAAPATPAPASSGDYLSQLNGAAAIVTPVSSIESTNSGDYLVQLNSATAPITVHASGGDYLSQLAGSAASATSGAGNSGGTGGYLLQLGSNTTPSGSGSGPSCYLLSLDQQEGGFTVPDFVELDECPVDGDYLTNLNQPATAGAPVVTPVSNVQASNQGDYLLQLNSGSTPISVQASSNGDYLSNLGGGGAAPTSGSGTSGATSGYLVQLKSNVNSGTGATSGAGPCYLLSLNDQPDGSGFSAPQPTLIEIEECDVVAQATSQGYLSALNQPVASTPSYSAPAAPAAYAPPAPVASTPSYLSSPAASAAPASTGDYLSNL